MTNEYKGYSLFNDVKNPVVRTWNRLNTIYDIKEQGHNALAIKYAQQFDKYDLAQLYILMAEVSKKGYENVRRTIIRREFA